MLRHHIPLAPCFALISWCMGVQSKSGFATTTREPITSLLSNFESVLLSAAVSCFSQFSHYRTLVNIYCQYVLSRVKRSLSWLNWRYVTNSLFISLPDPFSRPVSLYRPSWKIRGCDLGWSLTDRIVFQIPVSIQRVKKPSVKIINSTNSLHYNNMTALMMDSALCSVLKQS